MDPAARYQETLRRLAIIDESAVEQHAGLGLGLPGRISWMPGLQSWRGSRR